jgi:phosphomannomutase
VNPALAQQVSAWIAHDPDDDDRAELRALLDAGDEAQLERRFGVPLTFGTAGLRGPVMAGPAGMNRLTVRRATQGVVAWLAEIGADITRGVVVGRDARRGSETFNDEVVAVLLGAGVMVFEMPGPLPTPLVAYCVKALGAAAGIMVTASHNPPLDNGYKLYASDGAQIIPPNDEIVERYARSAPTPTLADRSSVLHHRVPDEVLARYRSHFAERFGATDGRELQIAYTPLHGVGGAFMMRLFAQAGFASVTAVAEQFEPDGTFPTLPLPNPEEPGALDLATACADRVRADLVIANDPDGDRLGAAVRAPTGWRLLGGDEIGWLLASMLLPTMAGPRDVVATTIVSSTLLAAMAREAQVGFAQTLTGFKWISRAAGEGVLRFGYEEALGYAVDPAVADKDGMSAGLALARLAHDLAREGATLLDRLDEIESHFGVHATGQLSIRASGPEGLPKITETVASLRERPPAALGGVDVSAVVDLADGYAGLAPTDGVLLVLGPVGRVVVRPSGTEAKLKAYIEVTSPPSDQSSLESQRARAARVVSLVRADLERRLAF